MRVPSFLRFFKHAVFWPRAEFLGFLPLSHLEPTINKKTAAQPKWLEQPFALYVVSFFYAATGRDSS